MKKLICMLTLFLITFGLQAQVGVLDDSGADDFETTPISSGAVLEIRSNSRALLIPRLTTSAIDALAGIEGMIVFDTDTKSFKGYAGTSGWQVLSNGCQTANTPPTASDVQISDLNDVVLSQVNSGDIIKGFYTYSDTENNPQTGSTYQWKIANDASGAGATPIDGATNITYRTKTADANKFIGFCVIPNDGIDAGSESCTTTYIEVIPTPQLAGRINEVHYDNDGTDANEFVEVRLLNTEIADIAQYSFQLVKADGTDQDAAVPLADFTVGTNNGTYTYYYKDINPLGNNGKGLKLLKGSTIVDFISYEVSIAGATLIENEAGSTLSEGGNTLPNSSLQRVETENYWFATSGFNTKGQPNSDTQVLLPTVEFSEATASVAENGGEYTITLNVTNAGTEAIDVTLTQTLNGGATADDFSTTLPISFTIPANTASVTYTFTGVDDTDIDANESVTYTIATVSSTSETPQIGTTNTLEITITDDDACDNNIVAFGFNNLAGNETSVNADDLVTHLSNAVITRGNGLGTATNGGRFNATGADRSDVDGAFASNDYFEIKFEIASGYMVDLTKFNFNWERSGSGAANVAIRSNVDNFASDLATFSGLPENQGSAINEVTLTNHNNLTETVIFRVYAWGSSGTGSFGFEGDGRDIIIKGCVKPASGASVSFDATTYSINEGDGIGSVLINYSNYTGSDVTANISTSASPLYLNLEGSTFIIPSSPTTGTYEYTFDWTDNNSNDGNANFTLTLGTSSDYTVGTNASTTVTITEDDGSSRTTLLDISAADIQSNWANNFDVGSGTYVANSEGGVRLGSGSKGGLMTYNTPILFSGTTGTVIVTIGVKGWDGNEKSGIINVGSQDHTFTVSVDKDASTPEEVTHTFTNVPTNSEVSFETIDMNGDERFIIYNIKIEKED